MTDLNLIVDVNDYNDDSPATAVDLGTLTAPGVLNTDWVGFLDEIDYRHFTLATGANLTFAVGTTDDVKFTVWQMSDSGKMKSLRNITVKAGRIAETKALLMHSGDYYYSVKSVNAEKGGDADYSVYLSDGSKFYTKGNNADDTVETAADLGVLTAPGLLETDWVGFEDEIDYRHFTLATGANLAFTVGASDDVKFTVWQMSDSGKLKSLRNITVKAGRIAETKALLMHSGDYYYSVKSVNAEEGGDADYSVYLSDGSKFYTKGNNADDTVETAADLGVLTAPGLLETDWVGFEDEIDYRHFTLATGANLAFIVDASDELKFTVWQMQSSGKLKSLRNITVKAGRIAETKALLLYSGDYYYSVESLNAEKGGDADYSVCLSDGSKFYTKGNNADDTVETAADLGVLTAPGLIETDWVGFGDEIDYRHFTLATGANLAFTVGASDDVKFTVWQMQSSGKLKSLQSITVKADGIAETKALLLYSGDYYYSVESLNAEKGGDADYSVYLSDESKFYTKGNNADDTVETAADLGVLTAPGLIETDWVGFGDEIDYRCFTLVKGANLSFTISSSDELKFTIWKMESSGKLKSLQSVNLKAWETVVTKKQLLSAGDYYYSVESLNAKKGGDADYTVRLNDTSTLYLKGYNGDDTVETAVDLGPLTIPDLLETNWVGYDDEIDYRRFTLTNGGNFSFTVGVSDEAKFTIWQMQNNGKLKSLQSVNLKAGETAETKKLLLSAGDYYYSMESRNAKKGGDADYTVRLNDTSTLYLKGYNGDDTVETATDLGPLLVTGLLETNWVGFGDEIDYRRFTLTNGGNLSFTAGATDEAKFTIWQMQNNGKLKSLQSVKLKAGETAETKKLLLSAGDYYYSMESRNAKKGGDADYTVRLSDTSTLYLKGYNGDDTVETAVNLGPLTVPELLDADWVGYGDEIDYRLFSLSKGGNFSFTVGASDEAKFTIWQMQSSGKLKSLQRFSLKAGETVVTKKQLLSAGDYYYSMESRNAKKGGDADYTVMLNDTSSLYLKGYNGDDVVETAVELGPLTAPGLLETDWVGFGDEIDYRHFSMVSPDYYSFTVGSSDKVKFTIWQMQSSGKLKSLQSISLNAGQTAATKNLLLAPGDYYYSVQSLNAAKGGDADYTVRLNNFESAVTPEIQLQEASGKDESMLLLSNAGEPPVSFSDTEQLTVDEAAALSCRTVNDLPSWDELPQENLADAGEGVLSGSAAASLVCADSSSAASSLLADSEISGGRSDEYSDFKGWIA